MDSLRSGHLIDGRIRAITIQQPFASCTVYGPRRIEGRSFGLDICGVWVAIHAGKSPKYMKYYPHCQKLWPNIPPSQHLGSTAGCIIGAAYISAVRLPNDPTILHDPWLSIPESPLYVWIINDIIPLDNPIEHAGQLRVWWVDKEATDIIIHTIYRYCAMKTGGFMADLLLSSNNSPTSASYMNHSAHKVRSNSISSISSTGNNIPSNNHSTNTTTTTYYYYNPTHSTNPNIMLPSPSLTSTSTSTLTTTNSMLNDDNNNSGHNNKRRKYESHGQGVDNHEHHEENHPIFTDNLSMSSGQTSLTQLSTLAHHPDSMIDKNSKENNGNTMTTVTTTTTTTTTTTNNNASNHNLAQQRGINNEQYAYYQYPSSSVTNNPNILNSLIICTDPHCRCEYSKSSSIDPSPTESNLSSDEKNRDRDTNPSSETTSTMSNTDGTNTSLGSQTPSSMASKQSLLSIFPTDNSPHHHHQQQHSHAVQHHSTNDKHNHHQQHQYQSAIYTDNHNIGYHTYPYSYMPPNNGSNYNNTNKNTKLFNNQHSQIQQPYNSSYITNRLFGGNNSSIIANGKNSNHDSSSSYYSNPPTVTTTTTTTMVLPPKIYQPTIERQDYLRLTLPVPPITNESSIAEPTEVNLNNDNHTLTYSKTIPSSISMDPSTTEIEQV